MKRWWERLEWWFWRRRMLNRWAAKTVDLPVGMMQMALTRAQDEATNALFYVLYGEGSGND